MSRWESLKPREDAHRKGNRTRRQQHQEQSSIRSSSGWGRFQPIDQERGRRLKTEDSDAILRILEKQLLAYKSKSNKDGDFQSTVVLKNLDDFREVYQSNSRREIKSESFLLLINLLFIDDPKVDQLLDQLFKFLLEEKSVSLSKVQAMKCVTKISEKYKSLLPTMTPLFLKPLSLLLLSQAKILPAEETAQNILAPLLLPCLESSSTAPEIFKTVCQTLSGLFRHSKHVSAIMAPLIEDITPDGRELKSTNPLRKRIFSALGLYITSLESSNISSKQPIACYTLGDAVDASVKIDVNLGVVISPNELDVPNLRHFFLKSIQYPNDALFAPSIVLLRAIIRKYSDEISKGTGSQMILDLASQMILEPIRLSSLYDYTSSSGSKHNGKLGHLLLLVHLSSTNPSALDAKTVNLSRKCLAELVVAMPWKIWLQQGKSYIRNSTSGFRRKIVDSLLSLTTVTRSTFLRCCNEISIPSICQLIKSCFFVTQFEDENIVQAAINLWSTIAESLLSAPKSKKIRDAVVDLLVDSMGGRVMPNGEILSIYPPARIWLLSSDSEPFLNQIFNSAKKSDSRSDSGMKLVCAIFRTCPQVAFSDSLMRFQFLLETKYNSKATLTSLALLESFMFGRRDFGSPEDKETTKKITSIVIPLLERADSNVQSRCLSLNVYGALLSQDYETLGDSIQKQFKTILSLCTANNAKVRGAACKTIGDCSSQYVPFGATRNNGNRIQLEIISNSVVSTMLISLEDEKAHVRSMALFSLGNLAHVLRTSNALCIELYKTTEVCIRIHRAMGDSNDKVSGNAIRSAGHWGYLLLARKERESMRDDCSEIVARIVESLSGKLSKAVSLVSGEKRDNPTWRQRSAAKKHCWGACHSLACIFSGLISLDNEVLIASCFKGVQQLITCIELSPPLNEKIALASISALCELGKQQLAELTGKSGLLGDSLGTCIHRLYEHETQSLSAFSSKLFEETERYLFHLLSSASIMDASIVLKRDDCTQSSLSFLYGWMVEKDLAGSAFEIFALALQRRGFMSSDVSLEQNFASRSLQQYKKSQILSSNDLELDDAEI